MKPKPDTVISAINNACQSLTAQGTPLTKSNVWKLASMIVSVAQAMEQGKLDEAKAPAANPAINIPAPEPAPAGPDDEENTPF